MPSMVICKIFDIWQSIVHKEVFKEDFCDGQGFLFFCWECLRIPCVIVCDNKYIDNTPEVRLNGKEVYTDCPFWDSKTGL